MAAFLGPLIGLAAGGIGSLLGGNNPFTGLPKATAGASNAVLNNIPGQVQTGNAAVGQGLSQLSDAGNFYKTILGGSSEATQKLLGPEVSTVMKQYDNAAKSASNLGPRGGGKASALAQTETGKAGAYGKILGSALPGAAQGEAVVGQATAGVGTGLLGQANSLESSLFRGQTTSGMANAANFGALGSALGKWLGGLFGGKSSGSSDVSILD